MSPGEWKVPPAWRLALPDALFHVSCATGAVTGLRDSVIHYVAK